MKLTMQQLLCLINEAIDKTQETDVWQLLLEDWMREWHMNRDISQTFNDAIQSADDRQNKALNRFRNAMQELTLSLDNLAIIYGNAGHESLKSYREFDKISYQSTPDIPEDVDYSDFRPSYDDEEPNF